MKKLIYVENIKTFRPSDRPGHHVYIGRAMPGRPGSPLGNPFKLRFESERAEILARYEAWLKHELIKHTAMSREIEHLKYLARDQDLTLLCWCAPKECHGNIIKGILESDS